MLPHLADGLHVVTARAEDLAAELPPAPGQQGARLDQIGEPLLLHQPAHPHDPGRPLRRREIREPVQLQAVVDPLDARGR